MRDQEIETQLRIDELADRFEMELRDGRNPTVDVYVANNPDVADLLRQELEDLREEFLQGNLGNEAGPDGLSGGTKSGGTKSRETTDAPPLPNRPQHIGPYKLLEKLGEGGMGEVYAANQLSPVKRRVALKLIRDGREGGQAIARFEAERQALAMMDHPNIARVLDAGIAEDGQPYFAMEFVPGIPVTRYCDRYRLNIRDRLSIFVQVCRAIQHAHQKGILHRDLKPSNVLVTQRDSEDLAKVIDFGLAKALKAEERLTDRTLHTHVGQIVGTLEYMSPEQAEMNELGLDTRTDVYSLGVLLYELLTGSTPLRRESVRRDATIRVISRIANEEVTPPSRRLNDSGDQAEEIANRRQIESSRLHAMLQGELDWIALKALSKERERRYDSAGAMAEDVQRFLDGRVVQARPPSVVYRLRKNIARNKVLFAAAASSVILLIAGVVGTGVMWMQATAETKKAKIAEAEAKKSAAEQRVLKEREIEFAVREFTARQQAIEAKSRAIDKTAEAYLALAESKLSQARSTWLSKSAHSRSTAYTLIKEGLDLWEQRSRLLKQDFRPSENLDLQRFLAACRTELVRWSLAESISLADRFRIAQRPAFGPGRAAFDVDPDENFVACIVENDSSVPQIVILSVSSGKQIAEIAPYYSNIRLVKFSSDGGELVSLSVGRDELILESWLVGPFQILERRPIKRPIPLDDRTRCFVNLDHSLLLVSSPATGTQTFHFRTGELLAELSDFVATDLSDGAPIVLGYTVDELQMRDLDSGKTIWRRPITSKPELQNDQVTRRSKSAILSTNRGVILFDDGMPDADTIDIIDVKSNRLTGTLPSHFGMGIDGHDLTRNIAIHPSEKYFLAQNRHEVSLMDVRGAKRATFVNQQALMAPEEVYPLGLCLSHSGDTAFAIAKETSGNRVVHAVRHFETLTAAIQTRIATYGESKTVALALSHESGAWLRALEDGRLIWSAPDGKPIWERPPDKQTSDAILPTDFRPSGSRGSVAIDPETDICAAVEVEGDVVLVDAETGSLLGRLNGQCDAYTKLKFLPTKRQLITRTLSGKTAVWNWTLNSIAPQRQAVVANRLWESPDVGSGNCILATPDGQTVYVDDAEGNIHILDGTAGEEVGHLFSSHRSTVRAIELSFDRQRLISMTTAGRVTVWDIDRLTRLIEFQSPAHRSCMALHPQAPLLFLGGKGIEVYDLRSGARLLSLDAHSQEIERIGIQKLGRSLQLVSASEDGVIMTLDLSALIDKLAHQELPLDFGVN